MKAKHRSYVLDAGCTLAFGLGLLGCGDAAGTGTLSVLLEAEDTITAGLDPGDGVEDIRDGWQVRFDKYIAVLGDIEIHLSTDEEIHDHAEELFAVDLTKVPASGLELWEIPALPVGRWEFHYSLGGGAHGATRHDSVSAADFDRVVDADASYFIVGTLSKDEGRSCPPQGLATPGSASEAGENDAGVPCYENPSISFSLLVSAETVFGPCVVDEVPGFSITEGQTRTVTATIHGDHLFFNGFPEGDEGGVRRLAQWLADADLDLDGEVTRAELEAIAPSDLSEFSGYQLGGSPIDPLENLWDYVTAQLKTQGHMNGEGECPFDGIAHEHGDEHEEHDDEE